MKYLVTLYLFLNCSVLSRYISKRSLLGQHHHHPQPTDVYLPPAAPEDDVAVTERVTEPTVVETEAPAVKLAESYLVADEAANEVDTEAPAVGVADVVDVKSDDEEADETDAPVFKAVETYLVAEEVTEPQVVETEAPAVKLAETNLVADEVATEVPEVVGVSDVVDTKSGDEESETIEIDETAAPALKPAETYFVVEEVTDEVTEPTDTNLVVDQVTTKAPNKVGVTGVVDAKYGVDESEAIEADETAAPAIKPAETYLVDEGIIGDVTESTLLEVEAPALKPDETDLVVEEEIILDSNLLNPRIVNIPEAGVEEVAIHAKPASGYWIEVSGDRDVLVKYHD